MDKINVKVRPSGEGGLFHDSRRDVRVLGQAVNLLIEKVNELIDENNRLKNTLNLK